MTASNLLSYTPVHRAKMAWAKTASPESLDALAEMPPTPENEGALLGVAWNPATVRKTLKFLQESPLDRVRLAATQRLLDLASGKA